MLLSWLVGKLNAVTSLCSQLKIVFFVNFELKTSLGGKPLDPSKAVGYYQLACSKL